MINIERLGVILKPQDKDHAKFNAGMVKAEDKIHLLYRWSYAPGRNGDLCIKYTKDYIAHAEFDLNGKLIKDSDEPFIAPFNEFNSTGCQDPRIIEFEGYYYIFYTSWNLICSRVGIARTKDFKTVEHIGVIPTNVWDKDAFIFPERINGKIVYIHRIEPDIQIDFFDSFDEMLDENYWIDYDKRSHEKVILKSKYPWENKKIGGGIPPIKTEIGWLFIYHGVSDDRVPFCYRAGVAVLDINDPRKVIARLPYPILEPVEEYEINGDINNVVFPQGAYIHDGYINISYGCADKVVAMARIRYDELIYTLKITKM